MSKVKIIIVTQTYPPRIGGMQSVMQGLAKKLSEFYQVIVLPDHLVPKKEKARWRGERIQQNSMISCICSHRMIWSV